MKLDADGLPIPEPSKVQVLDFSQVAAPAICEKCGTEVKIGAWPWCPHGVSRYGWHFGQGQNDARREAFYAKRAADPFGDI